MISDLLRNYGIKFINYLENEWWPHEHMICGTFKRQHMCFLLKGTLGTNNPSESMMAHTKYNHQYRKKNILHFISDSIKIWEREFNRFENAQNVAKITVFGQLTNARTHGLYNDLVGNVSYFAIENMYQKLKCVVERYLDNDFTYKGTCTVLRMITNSAISTADCADDETFTFNMETWRQILESKTCICSCVTQGLYCGEYQLKCIEGINDNDNNFLHFSKSWKENVEDAIVKIRIIKLQPVNICSKWKVLHPIAPPQENNEAINIRESQVVSATKAFKKGTKLLQERRMKGEWEKFIQGIHDDTYPSFKYDSGIGIRRRKKRKSQCSQESNEGSQGNSQH